MNFNSLEFLIFLPVVAGLYWLLPHKFRWVLLLAASLFFYMSWNVWLIILIGITTVTAYVAAIAVSRAKSVKVKRIWLAATLVICLGILVFFKYINFLIESVVGVIRLFNAEQDDIVLNILLPVGISFYTFQTLSYVIDVYRGDYPAERHFGYFALYVTYFPQLVAGPIEKPGTLLPQLHAEHKINGDDMLEGGKWLMSGFFRKCVVADFCGIFVNKVYADLGSANGLAVFAASALFLFQIYNDFAGYSEIALGSARLMGVKLSHNFERPLSSASFTEFFRRWHITLNQWFTQYVYIPLGGNRKGVFRKLLNTMIVFALCGLWHGASWNFVLWGVTAGVFVCVESLVRKPVRAFCAKRNINLQAPTVRVLRQAAVFMLSVPCCILFRAQDIGQIGLAYSRIFTDWGFGAEYLSGAFASLGLDAQNLAMLIACFAGMVLIYRLPRAEKQQGLPLGEAYARVNYSCTAAVFIYGILAVAFCWLALLAGSDVSGFAYFQF